MSCGSDPQAKFRKLSDADGPRDRWRIGENRTAAKGISLHLDFCRSADIGGAATESWFRGVRLEFASPLAPIILPGYPRVHADREVAASEPDREKDLNPPDMCFPFPPNCELWQGEGGTRRVQLPVSIELGIVDLPVKYGAMDGLLGLLPPDTYMGGIDLQAYLLRWLVAASRRRYLDVRRPVSGVLGVYLFFPFGLGSPPEWGDFCVEVAVGAARSGFPTLRIFDFVGDLRLVDITRGRDVLAAGMTGLMSLLDDIGTNCYTVEGKRRRPTRRIPWLGFVVDTYRG